MTSVGGMGMLKDQLAYLPIYGNEILRQIDGPAITVFLYRYGTSKILPRMYAAS